MKELSVRERIIRTASDLFYFNGYNQTGINQIIKDANVAKASMYQHFRSKEEVAVAYLQGRHHMWMGKLFDFVSHKKSNKEKIIASFDYLLDWLNEVNFRGCGFQNIICDIPNDHDKVKAQVVSHKNDLRKWIQSKLKEDGDYSSKEADELGDEILVLIEGAIMLSQIQTKDWPITSAKNTCIKLLS